MNNLIELAKKRGQIVLIGNNGIPKGIVSQDFTLRGGIILKTTRQRGYNYKNTP